MAGYKNLPDTNIRKTCKRNEFLKICKLFVEVENEKCDKNSFNCHT